VIVLKLPNVASKLEPARIALSIKTQIIDNTTVVPVHRYADKFFKDNKIISRIY